MFVHTKAGQLQAHFKVQWWVEIIKMSALTIPEEVSSELMPARIEKQLSSSIPHKGNWGSPFIPGYDIVKDDLLQLQGKGSAWHQKLVNECKEDPATFEKPITWQNVKKLAYDAKLTIKNKTKKLKKVSDTRDLFSRLICFAITQNINLALSYLLLWFHALSITLQGIWISL